MTQKPEQTEHHKENMLDALKLCLGVVATACRKVNVGRTQHYQWLIDDPEYKKRVDEVKEEAIDLAESKIFQLINGFKLPELHISNYKGKITKTELDRHYPPNVASIIFYLKTQAKKRGYIERQEIEINTKSDVQQMLENLDQLTDEQLEKLSELTAKLGNTDSPGEA